MTEPPTESGEGNPGPVTRIAEEFIRLHEAGEFRDLDDFCARYPEDQRQRVRQECEQLVRIHGAMERRDALTPGQTLASYEIVGVLGKGGMGEVYRARDRKLDRYIAIKLLPNHLTSDRERLARFHGEAKVLASLNHTNIGAIYGLEEAEGVPFLVMELVGGETLAERIARGRLGLAEALRITAQIAEGLEAAHEGGVIHRDLKPANVKITSDGRVKVLDFGLAKKSISAQGSTLGVGGKEQRDPTLPGVVLGTPAYMSPEQGGGRNVDRRTDIWSLGAILFECLTGKRPFRGGSATEILGSVLHEEPDLSTLPAGTPPRARQLLRRMLEKDRDQRMRDAGDVMLELRDARADLDRGSLEPATAGRRSWYLLLAVPVLAVGLAVGWSLGSSSGATTPLSVSFTKLTDLGAGVTRPSLSPDGRTVIYAARESGDWDIFALRVGAFSAINLTEDFESDDLQPAFSPDGERIAFRSERDGGGIFIMTAAGESPVRVTDTGYDPAWSPDGEQLVYATEGIVDPYYLSSIGRLWTVSVAGQQLRELDLRGRRAFQPVWSPGGTRIAFWSLDEGGQRDLFTAPVTGGAATPVTDDAATDWNPVWSSDGEHLFFCSDRGGSMNLWRVAVDEDTGRVRGEFEPVTAGAAAESYLPAVSRDSGRIAYVSLQRRRALWRAGFDTRGGRIEGVPEPITSGSVFVNEPDLSPDGEWFIYTSTAGGREDLGMVRADGSDPRRLTDDEHKDRRPRWSPDGTRIAFYSNRDGNYGIYMIRRDGSRLTPLTRSQDDSNAMPAWSPDGRIIHGRVTPERNFVVNILDGGESATERLLDELPPLPSREQRFEPVDWSPGGDSIAGDLFDQSLPAGILLFDLSDRSYITLTEFGRQPTWLRDGRRLLFVDQSRLHVLDIESRTSTQILDIFPDEFGHRALLGPEEETLYFLRASRQAEIWMIEIK